MMIGAEKQEANMPKMCALYNVKRIPEKLISLLTMFTVN